MEKKRKLGKRQCHSRKFSWVQDLKALRRGGGVESVFEKDRGQIRDEIQGRKKVRVEPIGDWGEV